MSTSPKELRGWTSPARVDRGPSEGARSASKEVHLLRSSIPYLTAGKEGVHDGIFFGGIFF